MKDLLVRWERAKAKWDDPQSRKLEEDFIAPLKPKIRATLTALERVGAITAQARRECE
jgi:hypothetical protein